MREKANTLTIGGLSKATEVHIETIRYYQRRGLLVEPERPAGGVRRYGAADIDRLTFVKAAQRLGFSLDEIGDLLRLEDGTHCREAGMLAEHKLQDVREKIGRLERIEKVLSDMVCRCQANRGSISCPLIDSLHEGLGKAREPDN